MEKNKVLCKKKYFYYTKNYGFTKGKNTVDYQTLWNFDL